MSEVDIDMNLTRLSFMLSAIKLDKPVKPLRRRVSKKYRKIQTHYLEIIERYNKLREAHNLSLQIIVETVEHIKAIKIKELKTEELEKQVQEQREVNLQLYKSFTELKKIMRIAIEIGR